MSDVNTTLTRDEVAELYRRPLLDLVFEAARIHRANHDPVSYTHLTLPTTPYV